jgi:hypothetical protein
MKVVWTVISSAILLAIPIYAASKPHVVAFGKWTTINLQVDDDADTQTVKMRTLLVDAKAKEFTVGPAHEITITLSQYSKYSV